MALDTQAILRASKRLAGGDRGETSIWIDEAVRVSGYTTSSGRLDPRRQPVTWHGYYAQKEAMGPFWWIQQRHIVDAYVYGMGGSTWLLPEKMSDTRQRCQQYPSATEAQIKKQIGDASLDRLMKKMSEWVLSAFTTCPTEALPLTPPEPKPSTEPLELRLRTCTTTPLTKASMLASVSVIPSASTTEAPKSPISYSPPAGANGTWRDLLPAITKADRVMALKNTPLTS